MDGPTDARPAPAALSSIDESKLSNEAMLDFARQNMIKTLELFFEHTKYSLTLLVTVLTAVLAIAAFSLERAQLPPHTLRIVGVVEACLLILMLPVAYVLQRAVARYYKLYVSCYVYAARLHERAAAEHPWFVELKSRVRENELFSQTAVSDFMDNVVRVEGHSWKYYRWLIMLLGSFGFACGGGVFFLVFR